MVSCNGPGDLEPTEQKARGEGYLTRVLMFLSDCEGLEGQGSHTAAIPVWVLVAQSTLEPVNKYPVFPAGRCVGRGEAGTHEDKPGPAGEGMLRPEPQAWS